MIKMEAEHNKEESEKRNIPFLRLERWDKEERPIPVRKDPAATSESSLPCIVEIKAEDDVHGSDGQPQQEEVEKELILKPSSSCETQPSSSCETQKQRSP